MVLSAGLVLLVASAVVSICTGSSDITICQLIRCLVRPENAGVELAVLKYVRLPRTLACVFAGAALGVSGAIMQSVLANKLASPGIIGVNAGAGLGITLCCAFGAASGFVYSLSAFIGSVVAVLMITAAAYKTKASRTTVILGGVAVNAVLNAFSEAISVLNNDAALMSVDFRVGGFSSVSYIKLIPAMAIIALCLILLMTLMNDLEVLTMGDETARGLGMNVRRTKNLLLILGALMAGAAVSFSGLLGFIGLVVPNFVRRLFPGNAKLTVAGSAVFGSIFLTFSDILARVIFAPFELPVGIIMAFVGGPVFIVLLVKGKGGHTYA